MSKYPWFRLYTETVDDEKLRLLAFEDRWHFVALLCCKGSGLLDSGDDDSLLRRKLAVKLGLSVREFEEVAGRLSEVALIDAETLQPSMHLVATKEKMRPHQAAWSKIRSRIFDRDDYTCTYCGERGGSLECDHVIPVSRGGGHADSNLTTSCRKCNRSKRDRPLSEWSPC